MLQNKTIKQTKNAGYTIVEILVYIAIFAFVSIAVIDVVILATRTASNAGINHTLEENGYSAIEGISRMIRLADAIDVANSVFDSNDGVLTLLYYDGTGAVTTKKIYVSNSYYLNWLTAPHSDVRAVQVDENGTLLAPFTGRDVKIDSLVFKHIETANSEAVKIELTITARNSRTPRTEYFYDTIILRNTYK